jgi:hypothetical protein
MACHDLLRTVIRTYEYWNVAWVDWERSELDLGYEAVCIRLVEQYLPVEICKYWIIAGQGGTPEALPGPWTPPEIEILSE